jgi:hypothetical protein
MGVLFLSPPHPTAGLAVESVKLLLHLTLIVLFFPLFEHLFSAAISCLYSCNQFAKDGTESRIWLRGLEVQFFCYFLSSN